MSQLSCFSEYPCTYRQANITSRQPIEALAPRANSSRHHKETPNLHRASSRSSPERPGSQGITGSADLQPLLGHEKGRAGNAEQDVRTRKTDMAHGEVLRSMNISSRLAPCTNLKGSKYSATASHARWQSHSRFSIWRSGSSDPTRFRSEPVSTSVS